MNLKQFSKISDEMIGAYYMKCNEDKKNRNLVRGLSVQLLMQAQKELKEDEYMKIENKLIQIIPRPLRRTK